jgi:Ca2+-binding EF-hand superfamily protein
MKPLILALAAAALASAAHAQMGAPSFDGNADGRVTLEEFQAGLAERAGRMFDRMDANADGQLAGGELGERAQRMLERLDTDKNGVLTRTEMAAGQAARFEALDANKDGWLSPEELASMRNMQRGGR